MISMTIRHSLSVSGFPISVSSCFIVTVFTACQFYTQSMFLLNLSLCSFNLLFSFIFYPFHFLYSLVLKFSTHSNGLGTRTPPSFCSGLPGRPDMISSDDHNYNHDDHTDDDDDHTALMMMMMDLAMEHPELLRASAAAPMFESNFSPQRDT